MKHLGSAQLLIVCAGQTGGISINPVLWSSIGVGNQLNKMNVQIVNRMAKNEA